MSAGGADPASLRRLLPARSAAGLLAPYGRLLVGARIRLRGSGGALHVEEIGELFGASGHARVWPLEVGGTEVGALEIDPAPETAIELAAAEALLASLLRALAAAHAQRAMAGETLERYREINLLYRVGDALAGTLDPVAVPRRVLAEARGVIDGGGGGVWLAGDVDAGGLATGVSEGRAVAEAEAAGLRARLTDPELPAIVAAGPEAPEHLLWAPMMAREACLGGVWLTRAAQDAVFTASDLKLLTALATQAAAFLDNARLHQRALAQERLEQELRLAYEVQARLMPRGTPDMENWSVAGFWRPAREVSGDFYDLLPLGDALGVVVADVADKGMPAALFMAVTRSLLRAATSGGRSPAQTIADTNRLAALDAADGMFVTLWYGVLRPDGEVRYVNAGHNPPIVVRADGRVERLPRTGILVGWDADARFGEAAVALAPGDLLVAFTDGVTEARDPSGREFGEGRLLDIVTAQRDADAQEVLAAVRTALDAFVADAPTHDDCTLVVARFRTPPRGG
jgi:serine phosphatase RsbU (regulator of sigma subunit)